MYYIVIPYSRPMYYIVILIYYIANTADCIANSPYPYPYPPRIKLGGCAFGVWDSHFEVGC